MGKAWEKRNPEWKVWRNMKARCTNPNHEHYHCYGGRVAPSTVPHPWRDCGTPRCPCDDPTLCGTRAAYLYAWGNNSRRAELKGRPCVIEASGTMNTVLVRFLDTGERVTTSRRSVRRAT